MFRVNQFFRSGWLWKVAFILYIAAVAYLCFGSGDDLPSVSFSLFGIPTDKLVHFLMFLPFCPLAFLAFSPLRVKSWRCAGALAIIALCGTALAFGTEVVQYFLPTRAMEIKDFAADCVAIVLGSLVSFLCLPCGGRSQTR